MNPFFELIQVAIGAKDSFTSIPKNREDWDDLLKVVGQHNLLAITFPLIDKLHDEVDVPLGVYSRWAMVAEKVQQKNTSHKEACKHLCGKFLENGFRSCILKGQAAAALYPNPELRQCGDIDIWIEGERQTVVDFLRARFPVKKVVYHHCDVQMLKGISTEVHFTPTWMNAPLRNRKLQLYFRQTADAQFSNLDPELGFCVPTLRFDAVYMLIHIYRHVLDEGVGLRQLLDYYYVLKALSPEDRELALGDLKALGLLRFCAGVMYVLKAVFDMDESIMLTGPDTRLGSFLLDEILLSGNFGRFDPRNAHEKGESIAKHSKRKLSRALRFVRYFPGEVICMPLFMAWQYVWRRRHGYLYKGR